MRDLGLLGLLVVLLSWGDVAMPLGFVRGLPAVGLAPPYGIFPLQPALPISLEDVSLTVRRTTQRSELPLSLARMTSSYSASPLLRRMPGFVPRRLLGASF